MSLKHEANIIHSGTFKVVMQIHALTFPTSHVSRCGVHHVVCSVLCGVRDRLRRDQRVLVGQTPSTRHSCHQREVGLETCARVTWTRHCPKSFGCLDHSHQGPSQDQSVSPTEMSASHSPCHMRRPDGQMHPPVLRRYKKNEHCMARHRTKERMSAVCVMLKVDVRRG